MAGFALFIGNEQLTDRIMRLKHNTIKFMNTSIQDGIEASCDAAI